MTMVSLVASQKDKRKILEKLILSERIHLDTTHDDLDNFITHEYESKISHIMEDYTLEETDELDIDNMSYTLERIASSLNISLEIDRNDNSYTLATANDELNKFILETEENIEKLRELENSHIELRYLENIVHSVKQKNIKFKMLTQLNNFGFQVGLLAHENTMQIRKNYENISAIVVKVGEVPDIKEDIYLVIYPNHLKQETKNILASVNWQKIRIPDEFLGDITQIEKHLHDKIEVYNKEIERLNTLVYKDINNKRQLLNRIYTRVQLEREILKLSNQVYHGNNVFVVRSWVPQKDVADLEKQISDITNKYVISNKPIEKTDEPPTILNNNKLFAPFEMIVKMYGLPSYHEIDPTPFLALSICLIFGIMFGDIGQGFLYFVAGSIVAKKNATAGGLLKRLAICSMLFGFFYGSLFGLEQHQLPWLPSILGGSPLDTDNIIPILVASVVVGVILLTLSYTVGIINSLRRSDIEHGIFGSHGVFGYIFYISLILLIASITGVIGISPIVFEISIIVALIVMVFKEPLTHLIENTRPLIKGDKGTYFVENGFEGLETVLSGLSNAISFIRVGAFALNHAGLFLAFLIMSEMTDNIILKIFILVLGNILILTLEGLVVFVQCLRLEYYEMFNKYFMGGGYAYNPIILGKEQEII